LNVDASLVSRAGRKKGGNRKERLRERWRRVTMVTKH